MKTLLLTRASEPQWLQNIAIRLNGLVSTGSPMPRSLSFVLGKFCEEVSFYHSLPQAPYWKKRIHRDYPFSNFLGHLPLQFLAKSYSPPKEAEDYLKVQKPDAVLCSTLMLISNYADYDLAYVAKKLKIPLIGFVPTWDSLVTKTKLQVMPDLMFCWNDFHKEQLIKYHGMRTENIRTVGPYTHEEWLKPHNPTPKKDFFHLWGLDLNKPIITFIGSNPSTVGDESIAVESLAEDYPDYQIIVRPHPLRGGEYYKLKNVWVIPGVGQNLNQNHEYFHLAFDTYFYSDFIYSVNSSAVLEAAIMGKRVQFIQTNLPDLNEQAMHVKPLWRANTGEIQKWLGIRAKLPSDLIVEEIKSFIFKKTE